MKKNPNMKRSTIFAWGATIAAIAGVILGFVQTGSPAAERARRFDQQRINDLQMITNAVDSFYNSQKRLPASIEEMKNRPDSYLQSQFDPTTGEPYEYRVVDEKRYDVCATFETDASTSEAGKASTMPVGVPNFWSHPQGQKCYTVKVNEWNSPVPVK